MKKIELDLNIPSLMEIEATANDVFYVLSNGWKKQEVRFSEGHRHDLFEKTDASYIIFYCKNNYTQKITYYDGNMKDLETKYFSLDEAVERQLSEEEDGGNT